MSLLTTTSLIVVWCTLEVVNSHMVIPQPIGNQQYLLPPPQDTGYSSNGGYQINTTYPGSQDGSSQDESSQKDGKGPYKMFYIEKDQFRCEECDGHGKVRGNMTYLDGQSQKIRTVKYETTDIPLDSSGQDIEANPSQNSFSGGQETFQQPQIQGQQLIQSQQVPVVQGQQLIQSQLPGVQGQQYQMAPPLYPYQNQPIQALAQNYQGNQAVFGPLNSDRTYPLLQQQTPTPSQLPAVSAPIQPTQNILPGVLPSSNFMTGPYATSPSFPFALEKTMPESVSLGIFNRPLENKATTQSNQGSNVYPTIETLAAEALRNLQPNQPTVPTIQPSIPSQPQLSQSSALNYGYGNMAQRFNFMNSNGVNDKPEGSILSSPSYQQPLFSPTGTGVVFNRFPDGGYGFNYKTRDSSRQETADGKNNVVGSYAFRDPDGRTHNVEYSSGVQGFNPRESSGAPSPTMMPAMILVPQQQSSIVSPQIPLTFVATGSSPISTTTSSEPVDKTKDDDSTKPSDNGITETMLQQLAKEIVSHMADGKSGSTDGNDSPTAEGEPSVASESR